MPHIEDFEASPVARLFGRGWLRGRLAPVAAMVSVGVLFAACSGGGQDSERAASTTPVEQTTGVHTSSPEAQTTTAAVVSQPTHEATTPPPSTAYTDSGHVWTFANQAGYSYEMRIALGLPTRYRAGDTLSGPSNTAEIGSACTVDPKTDVVIPMRWTATATTKGYDTEISMRALILATGVQYSGHGIEPLAGDSRVSVEQYFSDGPECEVESSTNNWGYGGSSGFDVHWTNPVAAGSTVTSYAAIIVKNYYTPAAPDGDPELLNWIGICPLFGGGNTDAAIEYQDTDGMNLGIYSHSMVALNGRVIDGSTK